MQIIFYENKSDDKTVPKTLQTISTINGYPRETMDLLNPIFTITSQTPISANYMYIADFNRYYFCTVEIIRKDIYKITGKVDVIQSFWGDIINCPAIVRKSRNLYNAYINDKERQFYQYTHNQYIELGDIGAPEELVMLAVG